MLAHFVSPTELSFRVDYLPRIRDGQATFSDPRTDHPMNFTPDGPVATGFVPRSVSYEHQWPSLFVSHTSLRTHIEHPQRYGRHRIHHDMAELLAVRVEGYGPVIPQATPTVLHVALAVRFAPKQHSRRVVELGNGAATKPQILVLRDEGGVVVSEARARVVGVLALVRLHGHAPRRAAVVRISTRRDTEIACSAAGATQTHRRPPSRNTLHIRALPAHPRRPGPISFASS